MEQNAQKQYLNYQTMVSQVNEGMASLGQVCDELGLQEHSNSLQTIRDRMKNQIFSVGIMGEFRRGKSTVINSLLGKEIVPSDIVPTSATLNYIRWDASPRSVIHFKDGTEKTVGIDELSSYITKIDKASEAMAATVEDAVVYYPCQFCQNGVQIVDTPGLNDDERMTAISEKVIPTLDAIIMVLVPDSPFSMTEADFVRTKVMTSDLGRIIFVVNKIDNVRKKDRQRLLDSIKEKIQESVMEKMAAMYGKDSEEYKEAENKISGIRIFGISARNALDGRLDGDDKMVEESGILEFEDALSHLLTEERGMLGLMSPVNSVLSIAKEARKSIAIRRDALAMDKDELKRITDEAEEAIRASREQKLSEVNALKSQAATLNACLLPELAAAYDNVERQLAEYVEQVPIAAEELKNNAAVEKKGKELSEKLEAQLKQSLSDEMEKLMVKIQTQVGKDVDSFRGTAEEITTRLNNVQSRLISKQSGDAFEWGVAILDSAIPTVGLGGFVTGWRTNGLPGALVGGGAGLAAGAAAYYGTLALCFSVLGMTSVLALPVFLVAGIASTFGGKAAVEAVFKKKMLEKKLTEVRMSLRSSVKEAMNTVRTQRVLEQWLSDTTSGVYSSVANEIDQEIENTLTGFAKTLNQLTLDRQKKESDIAAVQASMDKLDKQLNNIAATIKPVKDKLAEALSSAPDQ